MLHRIRIKSLEDIALGLIKRDNETKKDLYNYHDTVKVLGFDIKSDIYQNSTKKEDLKIITASKKEQKSQEEITKSLKTTKTMNSTNNANCSNGKQKVPAKRISSSSKSCKQINCGIKKDNIENNLKEKHIEDSFVLKTKKLFYNDKLFFPLDYNNINLIISNCYFPLLQCFQSYDNFKSMLFDIAEKLEKYFNNDSFFTLSQKTSEELDDFIEEEKILELIEFSLIIFLLQYFIRNNNNNNNCNSLNSSTTKYITAGVSGTVEKIYGEAGDDAADVMIENGALMLVKNGDSSIKVIGSEGTISSVNVSEGSSVSATTKVITITSDLQSGEYLKAVKDREEMVDILETLISIRKNGGITASVEGMVEEVSVSGEEQDLSAANDYDDSVHTIEAFTMTNLSGLNILSTSIINDTLLEELKAGAGRIEGTTKDMEYADKEDAESEDWKECTDVFTEVEAGTWYVRFKATDTEPASESVKIEVTQDADDSSYDGEKGSADKTTESSTSSESESSTEASGKTDEESTSGSQKSTSKGTSSENTKNGNVTTESGKSDTETTTTESAASASSKSESESTSAASGKSDGSKESTSSKASGSDSSTKSGSSAKSSSSSVSSSSSGNSSDAVSMISAFTISKGDEMKVTVNVDELDILTMEEGMFAEITLDAVENKTFEGVITNVSGSANESNGSAQYPVEITFQKTDEMLSGMNASVAVIIEEAENVIIVPLAAITDEGRNSYVYTGYDEASDELTGKTEVTLGMSDENSVEIKSGLSEGDTVYYEMKESENSDSKTGRNGMGGMGMPGMSGSGDMKMDGGRSSGSGNGRRSESGGERPSGDGNGGPGK